MDEPTPAPPVPKLLERGRYAVYEAPDGWWVLARAVDVCDTCKEHGCGEQAEPIVVPAMVIKMASMRDAGMVRRIRAMLGARGELEALEADAVEDGIGE